VFGQVAAAGELRKTHRHAATQSALRNKLQLLGRIQTFDARRALPLKELATIFRDSNYSRIILELKRS
jgi:hypothetical protein